MAKINNKLANFRFDSAGLMRILGGLKNTASGIGTERDKGSITQIADILRLSPLDCSNLCRGNQILQTIVECYPLDAGKSWAVVTMANQSQDFDAESLWKYMNLKDREDLNDSGFKGINDDCKTLKDYFVKANVLARKYGDCYLVLGVADGEEPDQPIKWDNISSFVGVKICKNATIDAQRNLYNINDKSWHPDRVIRFTGCPLYDDNGDLLPESDSVLQSVFTAFARWEKGNASSASMLEDYNFLLIGIKGLGKTLMPDKAGAVNEGGIQGLISRLLAVDMNRSVSRSVAHDLDNEKVEMVARTWAGANDIMESLKAAFTASTDIPSWRIFNDMAGGGLSNNVNTVHVAKGDWNDRLLTYKERKWRSPLEYILNISMRAKNSPTGGKIVDAAITFPTGSYTSELEKIQIENEAAKRSKILIDSRIISPEEARTCYQNNEFTPNITLTQSAAPETEPTDASKEKAIGGDLRDAEPMRSQAGADERTQKRQEQG